MPKPISNPNAAGLNTFTLLILINIFDETAATDAIIIEIKNPLAGAMIPIINPVIIHE